VGARSTIDPFARFSPATRAWFSSAFEAPTRPQMLGWPAIADGDSTLILSPTGSAIRQPGEALDFDPTAPPPGLRAQIDAAVKAANATLGPNQRIAGWRLWPELDFPRTHTLKIRRDQVRAWAAVEAPLPVASS